MPPEMWFNGRRNGIQASRGRPKWRTRTQEPTQVLANFAASLRYENLPAHARDSLQESAARRAGLRSGRRPRRRNRAGRGARRRDCAVARVERDRRRPAVARRRDHAQRLSDHRRHHVRHPSRDADPCHAGGDAAGARHRRARRCVRPRSPGRARRRHGGDDADRHRHRLSGVPRQGLARAGHARPVRRRGGGRPLARLRRRNDGQGVRSRRQPVGRHVRRLGHADGEIPPMPRRAVRLDGGAARRAEIPRDQGIPHRQGRRLLQHLRQRRQAGAGHRRSRHSAGSSSRSRCGCGRRRRRRRP